MTTTEPAPIVGVDALTVEGRIVRIRPVTANDEEGLHRLYAGSAPDSLYRRFFSGSPDLVAEVARLIRPSRSDHVCLLAEEAGRIVGVVSLERGVEPTAAEFAAFVAEGEHGRGIGTLLLEHLTAAAERLGVTDLVGDILSTNGPMLKVAVDLGTGPRLSYQDGMAVVHLPTGNADTAALDSRDRQAARHSLTPLLAPRSVAVIGAGREPGGVGHVVLANLMAGGFTGALYAINPHADTVAGVTAYPSIGTVPGPVDLAVIAVPAASVGPVLDECGTAGVKAVVVLSAGFGETGPAGRAAQVDLVRAARRHGIRLVGPNCLGILNTDPSVRLHATFATIDPGSGGLAVASQSGAVAITILDHVRRTRVGLSTFVSLGNKANVSGNDLLAYWYDDPATTAVALYLESVGNPRRFARIAQALSRRKPVLAVKSGRSPAGQRAGASHTAAAAAPDATVGALFAQAGVVRCDTLGELLDAARLFVDQPLTHGSRLGVVSNAGGVNVMIVDAADGHGLAIPAVAVATPGAPTRGNPIDLGAAATPAAFASAIGELVASGMVDSVLTVFALTGANDATATLEAIAHAADAATIPMAVVLLGVPDPPASLGSDRAPVYDLPEQAVAALAHTAAYAQWRATPTGKRPQLSDVDTSAARALIERALVDGEGWQPGDLARALLRCYGIRVVRGRTVTGVIAVLAAADELGYPVVLKAADPELVHKSGRGAVRLNLADGKATAAAYAAIATALRQSDPSVLVQPMLAHQVELIGGIVHDPVFGSVVMLGLGGIHTEIVADRALRLLPVTDTDAAAMWRSLRAAALLTGPQGEPNVYTAAVEDLVSRLGRLAEDIPEVAELDLNPVLVASTGIVAVDVKLRLTAVGSEQGAAIRSLREPS